VHQFAGGGAARVDGGEKFLGIAGIGEARDGNVREIGIGEVGGAIGENAAHHFDDEVNALRVVPALQGNILEHVEGFDHGDATGAWRRSGEDFPTMGVDCVAGVENFADFRLVMGEIIEGDEPAERRAMSRASICAVSP